MANASTSPLTRPAKEEEVSFETGHVDAVHDAQLDYYGKRLATTSSDRTIRVFDVSGGKHVLLAKLEGHEGPVWRVSWSHPSQGSLIVSCSFDATAIVWKEVSSGRWEKVYVTPRTLHQSSINCVVWAPHQLGMCFACGSSDGSLSIVTRRMDGGWDAQKIPEAHALGVNSVSWAPLQPGASGEMDAASKYLVSGGCDNCVRIWSLSEGSGLWSEVCCLEGHSDWVRDVAWAPEAWVSKNTIASCSQDGTVIVWTLPDASQEWQKAVVQQVDVPVWSVSWSLTGDILACSDGNNNVTLWKEALDGQWQKLSDSI